MWLIPNWLEWYVYELINNQLVSVGSAVTRIDDTLTLANWARSQDAAVSIDRGRCVGKEGQQSFQR